MAYHFLEVEKDGNVGIITINNPPRNGFSIGMIQDMLQIFNDFELNDSIRAVMLKSTGPNFSQGYDAFDMSRAMTADNLSLEAYKIFSDHGLMAKIETYPKPTLVAARGMCVEGSAALFNVFDIRIVSENFYIKDTDIYSGHIGIYGINNVRLPIWIGRNKIMDYVFLDEGFNGHQAYELGIASKVVPNDMLDEMALLVAKKMATAAPVAVRYFKECIRKSIYQNLNSVLDFERKATAIVSKTQDAKDGILAYVKGEQIEFQGK